MVLMASLFGLAYHCQNNDFKILKIVLNSIFNNNTRPRFEAKVYTLGTDLWRRIEFSVESVPNLGSILDIQYEPFLLFNGALHFMTYFCRTSSSPTCGVQGIIGSKCFWSYCR